MSLKIFLTLIILGTIASWISFGFIIFYFDPGQTSFLGFSLLYLSLFLGLSGLIFLVNDWIKTKIFKNQSLIHRLRKSLRHAILFTILILGWAFLKSKSLLNLWNLILFILIIPKFPCKPLVSLGCRLNFKKFSIFIEDK